MIKKDNTITIVTAFFDIGRGNLSTDNGIPSYLVRTNDTYFEYFSNLATLDNPMVVFTSIEFKDRILEIRGDKPTHVIILDLSKKFKYILKRISNIQSSKAFIDKINPDLINNIEYWSAPYVLVTNLKSYFVNKAIKYNFFNTTYYAWVDFGYVRNKYETLNNIIEWKYSFSLDKINLFTIRKNFCLKSISDVYSAIFNNEVFVIGGAIVGTGHIWGNFYDLVLKAQYNLLQSNIVDDDQGVFLMCLLKNRDLFKLNYLGKEKWFSLFKKYDVTSKISLWEKLRDKFV